MRSCQGPAQLLDLGTVAGLGGRQFGGERADDAAGLAGRAGIGCWPGGCGGCLLLGAQVLDPVGLDYWIWPGRITGSGLGDRPGWHHR